MTWYSICSRHQKVDPNCDLCKIGKEIDDSATTGYLVEWDPEEIGLHRKEKTKVHTTVKGKGKIGRIKK